MKQNSLLSRPIRTHLGIISQGPHCCPSPHSLFQRPTASKPRQPSYVLNITLWRCGAFAVGAFGIAFGSVEPKHTLCFSLGAGVSLVEAVSRGSQAAGRQTLLQRRDYFSSSLPPSGVLEVFVSKTSDLDSTGQRILSCQEWQASHGASMPVKTSSRWARNCRRRRRS